MADKGDSRIVVISAPPPALPPPAAPATGSAPAASTRRDRGPVLGSGLIALGVAVVATCVVIASTSGTTGSTTPAADTAAPVAQPSGPALASDLEARVASATDIAEDRGAEVAIRIVDRVTGEVVDNGNNNQFEAASTIKLLIADYVLYQDQLGRKPITADVRTALRSMLRSSDDSAAETLWWLYGRMDAIEDVVARYRLPGLSPGWDENWFTIELTTTTLTGYYAGLVTGAGGLNAANTGFIVENLRRSTPTGVDGFDQTFGLPAATGAEKPAGFKQGWMCCIGSDWVLLSTGIFGAENRFIVAIAERDTITPDAENDGSAIPDVNGFVVDGPGGFHARQTMTLVARELFPEGEVGVAAP